MFSNGNYYTNDSKKRLLDGYVIPGTMAFGLAISTNTGKAIFRHLYEARRDLKRAKEYRNLAHRDYSTRKQEDAEGWYRSEFAKECTYRTCLAYMMVEMSDFSIRESTAVRIINNELAACMWADTNDDFYNAGVRHYLNKLCNPAIHKLHYVN